MNVRLMRKSDKINRGRKLEQILPTWRSGIHYRRLGDGLSHGTGSRFSLLWLGTKKVGFVHDMGLHGFLLGRHVSMVLLGLFAGLLA